MCNECVVMHPPRVKDAARAYDVLDLIGKNQHALDMGKWAATKVTGFTNGYTDSRPITLADLTADSCGTVACFAGWTVAMAGCTVTEGMVDDDDDSTVDSTVRRKAMELLGLDYDEAHYLFHQTTSDELPVHVAKVFGPDPRGER